MKKKIKIVIVVLSALLVGCNFSEKQDVDSNSVTDEDNTYNIIQEENYIQDEIMLEELRENMGDNNYGLKKETLTISDTSAKGKSYYGESFKINYPFIYTIEDDNILYKTHISDLILNLVIDDLFSYYSLNDIKSETLESTFDYNIAYKDNNFLSLDYTCNAIQLFSTFFNYGKSDNRAILEVDQSSTTINLYFRSDFPDINPLDIEPDVIKREDIISDEEIFEILDNKSYKLVGGVEEAFTMYDAGNKSGYYITDEFLLKDDNKLQLIIEPPKGLGRLATIEIDYNWKEKLESKYLES